MLAEAVAQAKGPVEPRHLILVEILRLMPRYRDLRDMSGLVAWERAFQGALSSQDDESEVGQILWDVFEFGREEASPGCAAWRRGGGRGAEPSPQPSPGVPGEGVRERLVHAGV